MTELILKVDSEEPYFTDDTNFRLVIDPVKVCEDMGLLVLDPEKPAEARSEFADTFSDFTLIDNSDFADAEDKMKSLDWVLLETAPDATKGQELCEAEGLIVLDQSLDPDPYGNHGIPLLDRLAAMGWPASSPLVLERTDGIRAEDLL